MRRVVIPEWLDSDSGTLSEVSSSLSDLSRINRWFGGCATTLSLVRQVAGDLRASSFSLLEIAAGAGTVPEMVRGKLQKHAIDLHVTLVDRSPAHLGHRSANGTWAVAGDALSLPFQDASFDLVSCCLFAHHLSPEELVRFIDEGLRVCRRAVLINDLIRHALHLALVYAGWPIYRSRLTRHDAPASVRQAYTTGEMRGLLQRTRATRVEMKRHFLFRMGVIVWK